MKHIFPLGLFLALLCLIATASAANYFVNLTVMDDAYYSADDGDTNYGTCTDVQVAGTSTYYDEWMVKFNLSNGSDYFTDIAGFTAVNATYCAFAHGETAEETWDIKNHLVWKNYSIGGGEWSEGDSCNGAADGAQELSFNRAPNISENEFDLNYNDTVSIGDGSSGWYCWDFTGMLDYAVGEGYRNLTQLFNQTVTAGNPSDTDLVYFYSKEEGTETGSIHYAQVEYSDVTTSTSSTTSTSTTLPDGEYRFKFTHRDPNRLGDTYLDDFQFYVYSEQISTAANTTLTDVSYWNITGLYQIGAVDLNLTSGFVDGDTRVCFKATRTGAGNPISLLKDIEVTHNGSSAKFTPWTTVEDNSTYEGVRVYEDDWMSFGVRSPLYGTAIVCSAAIEDAPELVVNQSDVSINKTIYEIDDGDNLEINVTVHNTGLVDEDNATVSFYVDGVLNTSTSEVLVSAGSSNTSTFYYNVSYGDANTLLIRFNAEAENSTLEGISENNNAYRYFVKQHHYTLIPSSYSSAYCINNPAVQPCLYWINNLTDDASTCYAIDYSGSAREEDDNAVCAYKMALYYHYSGNVSYANKTAEALEQIGTSSEFEWLDRSKSGNVTPNEYNGSDEDYLDGDIYDYDDLATGNVRDIGLYGPAYDLIHEYMEENMTSNLTTVRDNLGRLAAQYYLMGKEVYSYGDRSTGVSFSAWGDYGAGRMNFLTGFGWLAMSILDYDGTYADTDGSPYDWIYFVEQDMLNYSLSGGNLPIADQMQYKDGLYPEGFGYREYWGSSDYSLYRVWQNTFKENLWEKYTLANGSLLILPYASQPNLLEPNICVAYSYTNEALYEMLGIYGTGSEANQLVHYLVNKSLTQDNGKPLQGKAAGFSIYNQIFTYNESEVSAPSGETSWQSPNGSVTVFRSSVSDPNQQYSTFTRTAHESAFSGHQTHTPDQLTFDIWSRGAYLIPRGSDVRTNGDIELQDGLYPDGLTSFFLEDDEGTYRGLEKYRSQEYEETQEAQADLTYTLLETPLDVVSGKVYVSGLYLGDVVAPLDFRRTFAMIDDRYFVELTRYNSTATQNISMVYPFCTTDGYTGATDNDYDNWGNGTLYVNGSEITWYNTTAANSSDWILTSDIPQIETVKWRTRTWDGNRFPTQNHVNMTMYANPMRDGGVRHFGMHYGTYDATTATTEWVCPNIRLNVSTSDAKQVNVFYAANDSDSNPSYTALTVTGGSGDDYCTNIQLDASFNDTVCYTDGEDISYGLGVATDMEASIVRENTSELSFMFGAEGTYLNSTVDVSFESNTSITYVLVNVSNSTRYDLVVGGSGSVNLSMYGLAASDAWNVTYSNGTMPTQGIDATTNTSIWWTADMSSHDFILTQGEAGTTTTSSTSTSTTTTISSGGGMTSQLKYPYRYGGGVVGFGAGVAIGYVYVFRRRRKR